jgi:hypothetical protein
MKNYNYKTLSEAYNIVSEKASLALKKEMFREECWDATADRPIPECWTESGDIKDECWSSGPGSSGTVDGGAIAGEAPIADEKEELVFGKKELASEISEPATQFSQPDVGMYDARIMADFVRQVSTEHGITTQEALDDVIHVLKQEVQGHL